VKSLIIFDLDGTLAESKSALDGEMAALLGQLLRVVKVAIISGGAWPQYQEQVLSNLPSGDILNRLSLLPTCGTKFYQFDGAWRSLYSEDFSADDKGSIISALNKTLDLSGLRAEKHWGDVIEDRGSQITFSALGQEAPLDEKKKWDPSFEKREKISAILKPLIPGSWQALLPAALYGAVHVIEGETVTPILLARRFTLNPVLVVFSFVFWFWLWGVPGAILSAPILATTKIVCDRIRPLAALGHILAG
jgi:HAD superfamily hydrolase (TIGR01484 family)